MHEKIYFYTHLKGLHKGSYKRRVLTELLLAILDRRKKRAKNTDFSNRGL